MSHYSEIQKHLGAEAENLLGFNNPKIKKEQIHSPRRGLGRPRLRRLGP
jgi:hypothetical protein